MQMASSAEQRNLKLLCIHDCFYYLPSQSTLRWKKSNKDNHNVRENGTRKATAVRYFVYSTVEMESKNKRNRHTKQNVNNAHGK